MIVTTIIEQAKVHYSPTLLGTLQIYTSRINAWAGVYTHTCMMKTISHTFTGRFTARPPHCLTGVGAVSHQDVAWITAVSSCLCKCCSIRVTNSAILWVLQSTTIHSCQNEGKILDTLCVSYNMQIVR